MGMALADRLRTWVRQLVGPGERSATQMRIDRVLVSACISYQDVRSSSAATSPDALSAIAYDRANTGPGGAPHLAWQRIAPIYVELRPRWKLSAGMLGYVLGYAVGSADGGALTPEELEILLVRLARRGAVVINESLTAENMDPLDPERV